MNQRAALEAKIVEVCAKHKSEHQTERNYRAAVYVETDYFVKFGNPADLLPEIETQKYLSNRAMSDPGHGVPRIPRVVHSFEHSGTMYLVMEFIKLLPTPADFIAEVTAALVCVVASDTDSSKKLEHLCVSRASRPLNGTWARRIRCSRSRAGRPYLPSRYTTIASCSASPTWTPATSVSTSTGIRSCWISPR